jgi:hypothetical protein
MSVVGMMSARNDRMNREGLKPARTPAVEGHELYISDQGKDEERGCNDAEQHSMPAHTLTGMVPTTNSEDEAAEREPRHEGDTPVDMNWVEPVISELIQTSS